MSIKDIEDPKWIGKRLPTLYSRTAKGKIVEWTCRVAGRNVCVCWGAEDGIQQDASFECRGKNAGRANATTDEQQAKLEAIAKWKKQVKRKYFLTREEALATEALKPMLASSYGDHAHKIEWPAYIQPKLDGLRCLASIVGDKVRLQSRGGEDLTPALKHIAKAVRKFLYDTGNTDLTLDGEIYAHGMSLQEILSAARVYNESTTPLLSLVVYDVVNSNLTHFEHTYEWFGESELPVFGPEPEFSFRVPLMQLETYRVPTDEAVQRYAKGFVSRGFEGAIIRASDLTYRMGHRSQKLLKLKPFEEKEFKITGYRVGRGKAVEIPKYVCQLDVKSSVKTFEVVPEGTAEQRRAMLARAEKDVGKWLTVRFMGRTDEHVPKFAVGVCIRKKKEFA